jgi:hypothetical protein
MAPLLYYFHLSEGFTMKTKKSKIELAREIIANLRRGMNRPQAPVIKNINLPEATPFMPTPMATSRPRRAHQLQTSHF